MLSFPRYSAAVLAIALACAVSGCDSESKHSGKSTPRAAGPGAAGGIGAIRGTVTLKAEPPAMRELNSGSCHPGAKPVYDETVVVDAGGKLANVVVFLREAAGVATREPAVLDQVGCRYVPHVLALQTGEVLKVKTSDPAVHNVHVLSNINPARNIAMEAGANPIQIQFDRPEEFTIKCDIHPWMNANVHVFEHGQFAVTGTDGSFALNNVPAGEYTLVFRHELFGDIEETVTLKDGDSIVHNAVYEKPARL
jgi:plastocyanin